MPDKDSESAPSPRKKGQEQDVNYRRADRSMKAEILKGENVLS